MPVAGDRGQPMTACPYNPSQDVPTFERLSAIDYGDVPVVPGFIEESYESIEKGLKEVRQAGVVPIVLGGDPAGYLGFDSSICAPLPARSRNPTVLYATATLIASKDRTSICTQLEEV